MKFLKALIGILFSPAYFYRKLYGQVYGSGEWFVLYGLPVIVAGAAGRMVRVLNRAAVEQGELLMAWQMLVVFIISLVAYTISVWIGGHLLSKLSGAFGGREDSNAGVILCMTAYTPFMISQLLGAINPFMNPVIFLGIAYTLFLFSRGTGYMLGTPEGRTTGFTLIAFFIIFGLSHLVIFLISNMFAFGG